MLGLFRRSRNLRDVELDCQKFAERQSFRYRVEPFKVAAAFVRTAARIMSAYGTSEEQFLRSARAAFKVAESELSNPVLRRESIDQ